MALTHSKNLHLVRESVVTVCVNILCNYRKMVASPQTAAGQLVLPRQGYLPSGVHQRPDQSKLVHEIDSKRHSREAECAGGSDLNTPLEQPVADQHTEAVVSDPHQRQWWPWVLADPAFEVPVLSFYQQYRPSREA